MPELPEATIQHLHDAIFAAIEPDAEDLHPDETHGEAVKRVLRRELSAIRAAQERQRVREALHSEAKYLRRVARSCSQPGRFELQEAARRLLTLDSLEKDSNAN